MLLSSDCVGDERLEFWTWTNQMRGIGEREIGCGALKNLTQTSSADNERSPEQLFVLARAAPKLAHLFLTEVAQ